MNGAALAFQYINTQPCTQEFSANNIFNELVLCFNPQSFLRASLPFSSIYLFSGFSCGSCSLVAVVLVFFFAFSEALSQCSLFMIVRHIFEISDDSRKRITLNDLPTSKSKMEDDFSFRYATELYSIALYVNAKAELVPISWLGENIPITLQK